MKKKVFISYSREDAPKIKTLTSSLDQMSFDFWSDQEISPGQNWRDTIQENLRKSDIVLLFLSPRALASEWVMMEYGAAVASQKKIIPILVGDFPTPEFISKHKYIKASSLKEAADRIKEVMMKIAKQDAAADAEKPRS